MKKLKLTPAIRARLRIAVRNGRALYDNRFTVMLGDCIELMRSLPDHCVDSVVCDPPYGIEFMGSEFDTFRANAKNANASLKHVGDVRQPGDANFTAGPGPYGRAKVRHGAYAGRGQSKPGIGKRNTEWVSNKGANTNRCAACGLLIGHGGSPCTCEHPEPVNLAADSARLFQKWCQIWAKEALRVLKPGGYLLAFGGTRMYHRLACGIEDAGFEIRDSMKVYGHESDESVILGEIDYAYGCLSEDTLCLTRRGWLHNDQVTKNDYVMQFDPQTEQLSWVHPQRIVRKDHVGPMHRISNRHTDQLLTPDHEVLAKIRKHHRNEAPTVYEKVRAATVAQRPKSWAVNLPMAGRLESGLPVRPDLAYLVGWWCTDAWLHGDGKACMFSQSKPETLAKLKAALDPYQHSEYVKKPKKVTHNAEHTFYVPDRNLTPFLWLAAGKSRRLSWNMLNWSAAARQSLLDGLLDGDGSLGGDDRHAVVFWSKIPERRAIVMALSLSLGYRCYEDAANDCVNINLSTSTTQVQGKHKSELVQYRGRVWCLTVPTGAFVAMRNGRPFITGNSGFPKSLNVSKAVERLEVSAVERRFCKWIAEESGLTPSDIGTGRYHEQRVEIVNTATAEKPAWGRRSLVPTQSNWLRLRRLITVAVPEWVETCVKDPPKPAITHPGQWKGGKGEGTAGGNNFAGFGTALKPAREPIVVARSPLIGTVAVNVLRHGTGALNIDGSRVGVFTNTTPSGVDRRNAALADAGYRPNTYQMGETSPSGGAGRWPANVILLHHPACVEVGVKSVKGIASAGGTKRSGGILGKSESLGGWHPKTQSPDGKETIPDFRCHPECHVAALSRQSGNRAVSGAAKTGRRSAAVNSGSIGVGGHLHGNGDMHNDSGTAARFFHNFHPLDGVLESADPFFYCPKVSTAERNAGLTGEHTTKDQPMKSRKQATCAECGNKTILPGEAGKQFGCGHNAGIKWVDSKDGKRGEGPRLNAHPTVKPAALMRHLVRLCTPPGGLVLDPFCGSGSTGIAAVLEGFRFLGMEQSAEYRAIALARIEHWASLPENHPAVKKTDPSRARAGKPEAFTPGYKPADRPSKIPGDTRDTKSAGMFAATSDPDAPCPAPHRNGDHEWYLHKSGTREKCRACGVRRDVPESEAPPAKTPPKTVMKRKW